MRLSLRGLSETCTKPPEKVFFTLSLYEEGLYSKQLTHNVSGKRILRGTTEATVCSEGIVDFPNIVITEVSSRHQRGSFTLVVKAISAPYISDLRIPKIIVKARRVSKA